jgi:hypothetical protein
LRDEVIEIGAGRSIRYAWRENSRGLAQLSIHQINSIGKIKTLGILAPVKSDGFVMQMIDGQHVHFDRLPWWLLDMRPQGYLGRAHATRYGHAGFAKQVVAMDGYACAACID